MTGEAAGGAGECPWVRMFSFLYWNYYLHRTTQEMDEEIKKKKPQDKNCDVPLLMCYSKKKMSAQSPALCLC